MSYGIFVLTLHALVNATDIDITFHMTLTSETIVYFARLALSQINNEMLMQYEVCITYRCQCSFSSIAAYADYCIYICILALLSR